MTDKPQALVLADELELHNDERLYEEADLLMVRAAVEIRRLHAEAEMWKSNAHVIEKMERDAMDEVNKLREVNQELLEALKGCEKIMSEKYIEDGYVAIRVGIARAAIAKGEQK